MTAKQGDRIIIHGRTVGAVDRHGEILEVRGADGTPPYAVRFDDGHETLIFPGTDFIIEESRANAT
ncbi:MAG TPA: DUF1918 domain-containing protein [Microbacteriaceae bacterium]|jgi:hypothetical protein|nr:DUF1918 domain-containing protein [Microbacteriaceae bacterium]